MKELVVISGKGGTGKTSLTASFAALARKAVLADCDVDAADLHLILQPEVRRRESFVSGREAVIREADCAGCGRCAALCRFEAISAVARDSDGALIGGNRIFEATLVFNSRQKSLGIDLYQSLILFVGYQAKGTLGKALIDGAKEVKLFSESISVEAEIDSMPGISGHADKDGLIDWINGFEKKPQLVFVNHGEDEVAMSFAKTLEDEYSINTAVPYSGTSYDLLTGSVVTETVGIRIEKKEQRPRDARAAKVFTRLIAACDKLMRVAKSCDGMANKEIARFADQVEQLAEKWSR